MIRRIDHDEIAKNLGSVVVHPVPIVSAEEMAAALAAPTCQAVTRVKRNHVNHSIRCQHPEGHEGGHEAKDGARTTLWYGEVKPLPTNMRYRFGLDPHWMMKGGGGRDGGDIGNW